MSSLSPTQLSLLDLSGNSTGQRAEISWIPVTDLYPHPDNPRLIYRQDIIDTIAASIVEGGFKPEYALLVRPLADGYQVISGHTRLKAAQQAGCSVLPCWVKEMNDREAKAELRRANRQGELSYRERAQHTFSCVTPMQGKKGGRLEDGNYETLEAYAKEQSISRKTASFEYQVGMLNDKLRTTWYEVYERINQYEAETGKSLGSHQLAISKAPADDWQWLTELLLEEDWSVADTEAKVKRIKAVEELNCPEWLAPILQITKAKRRSINDDRIARTLEICIGSAVECYESLQPVVLQFPDGETLSTETWDLQAQYVDALANTQGIANNPTKGSFTKPKDRILRAVEEIKSTAERWKLDRAEGEEKARLQAEERRRREQLAKEYQPIGFVGDIRDVLPGLIADYRNSFDLVLTDPPYLLSNDGITARGNKQVSVNKNFADDAAAITPEAWFPLCLQVLKPGGIMAFSCTEHLNINVSRIEAQGFEFLERLFWIKRSAPPRLTPTGHRACVEEIWICKKPGDTHFFNYDLLKEKHWQEKQPSNYLEFEQCSGNERLGWHDTQKPLKLWSYLIEAYSPDGGSILDPFAGSGTTAAAAKQLGRKCCWVEMDEHFYQKASQRILDAPFFWEL